MIRARDSRTQATLDSLTSMVAKRISAEQQGYTAEFVAQYFAGTAAEDVHAVDTANLFGAAVAHLNFARQRRPGVAKVHVYNPQFQQHGWQSTHTIIEVVNDDMPFLVDSVRMALNRRGLTTHLIIHPVVRLQRDADGELVNVLDPNDDTSEAMTEAVMHCEVDRQTDTASLEGIRLDVERALADVRVAVDDWVLMREKLEQIMSQLAESPPAIDSEEFAEGLEFLEWMDNNHFTFLGYRHYKLTAEHGEDVLRAVKKSGLGILRNSGAGAVSESFSALSLEKRREARTPGLLILTKSSHRSTIHRPSYMDYIGIKEMDAEGMVIGEHRFLGLYTSAAYNRNPRAIPLLRTKVRNIVDRAGYPENSHAEKTLLNVVDTYPRDELFQVSEDEMLNTALGILHLQERQRIRLFVHHDRYGRFVSCIVFVPRDRFNTDIRLQIQKILEQSFNGDGTDFTVQLSASVLARLYFVIRIQPGAVVDIDEREIENRLKEVTRSWSDDLVTALIEQCGEERGSRLVRRYSSAFRADYREHYPPRVAVYDIEIMETLGADGGIAMSLYRPLEAPPEELQFKLFRYKQPISLSAALPMLENMGLTVRSERPSTIVPSADEPIWMHDFTMVHSEGAHLDLDNVRQIFQDAFERIWFGDVDNDGFNRLVLRASLSWREIVIMRACCKYLRQAGATFSQEYMEATLANNPQLVRLLIQLFHARFDPQHADEESVKRVTNDIAQELDAVANLDEDRILRSFVSLIKAMLRTNFYQLEDNGQSKAHVSFKFDPAKVPDLPQPRPMYEIFVYSPRVEGVHLRGGSVARGGLRWSDRREDFRTEVLGLVKAQMVKNAVIVPVGSKGGFVPKRLPVSEGRQAIQDEAVACYQIFIRGLLDITDNIQAGEIVPPENVYRHDSDDPYLVVAADKGTATFSDYANNIAIEYGHWLGDAFASGGSVGYDHKAMGITARGAWESVKRHFRELGIDTQNTEFTAIGVGDMGGDVFGNGMLQSKHTRLLGAFNHLHIFIDPQPRVGVAFKERQRLFDLPGSSWEDYDTSLISSGGGIFSRGAKSIDLSDEMRVMLDVSEESVTPNELIRMLLKAPADLLWNGGIGTYAKASHEQHSDVGDRANDSVRVDANELRCRVIGEGGNLGFTQLARVEFALGGGRIYTDAIDNSGGVDCSDHEVNIKILLNAPVESGDLTQKQRNTLLEEMTDEVAVLVLRNNYLQSQALSAASAQASSMLEVHERLIDTMHREGKLDPEIEFLPNKEEIHERRALGQGLTAPELSVLLAYVKIELFKDLLASTLPNETYFARELAMYFPSALRERFASRMTDHRLSREIISTVVANGLVNRAGITFCFRLAEETGTGPDEIARAFTIAREVFQMESFWEAVESLDNAIPAAVQTKMMLSSRRLIERATRWLLRNRPLPLDVAPSIEHFLPGVIELETAFEDIHSQKGARNLKSQSKQLQKEGVPEVVATRVAKFSDLFSALDIVEVAALVGRPVSEVAAVYFQLGETLDMRWLHDQIVALPRVNRWQALARAALRDDLYAQESVLTAHVLQNAPSPSSPKEAIAKWLEINKAAIARCRTLLAELKTGNAADFAMLSVAMREIRSLGRG